MGRLVGQETWGLSTAWYHSRANDATSLKMTVVGVRGMTGYPGVLVASRLRTIQNDRVFREVTCARDPSARDEKRGLSG